MDDRAEAIRERENLVKQGYPDAVAVECVRWDAAIFYSVFTDEYALRNFRKFNQDWDIKITVLA